MSDKFQGDVNMKLVTKVLLCFSLVLPLALTGCCHMDGSDKVMQEHGGK